MDPAVRLALAIDTLIGRLRALQEGARVPRVVVLEGPTVVAERVVAGLHDRLLSELPTGAGRGFGWWRLEQGRVDGDPGAHLVTDVLPQLADQVDPMTRAVQAARVALEGAGAPGAAEVTAPVAGVLRRWRVPGFPAPPPDDVLEVAGTDLGGDHRSAGAALAQVIQTLCHPSVPAVVVLAPDAFADEDGRALPAALQARRDLPLLTVVLADPRPAEAAVAWRRREVAAGTAQLLMLGGEVTADAAAATPHRTPGHPRGSADDPPGEPSRASLDAARALAAQYRHGEAIALAGRLLEAGAADSRLPAQDRLTLRHERASWIGESGRAREAAAAFRALTDELTADLGAAHPRSLAARLGLTTWLGTSGDLRTALDVAVPLVDDLQAYPDHVAGLEARALHLTWLTRLGAVGDALALAPTLAADQARVLGPAAPATVRTRDLNAHLLADAGRTREALAAYTQLARERAAVLGPDAPAVLTARSNIAFLLGIEAGPQEAIAAYSSLLSDQMRVLGPDHASTRVTRENLGAWLRGGPAGGARGAAPGGTPDRPAAPRLVDAAADDAALDRLTDLVEERAEQLGADHPDTLDVRAELAAWLGAARREERALAAYTDLLPDQERVLGPAHPQTVRSRRNLTFLAEQAGRYAQAADLQRRAVEVGVAEHRPDHPDVLQARHDLAYLQGLAGKHEEAVAGMRTVLDDRRRVLGEADPQVHATRHNLAVLLGRAGWHDEAARACTALADDLARWAGPEHPRTLASLASAAHWTARAGHSAQALTLYGDVLPRLEAALGAEHPDVVRVRARRAQLQAGA